MGEQFGGIAQKLGQYTVKQQTKDRVEKGYTSYTDKIVDEAKTVDAIKQLGASIRNSDGEGTKRIMDSVHKKWDGHQLEKAAENIGRDFTQPFQASSQTHPPQWYRSEEHTSELQSH